jgi:hypothetical protein
MFMNWSSARTFAAAGLAAVMAASSASGQQPKQESVRVLGKIERLDGPTLVVKQRDGSEAKVNLAANARVFGVVKASAADLKKGDFIGVGATPQADGTQKAIRVMIFSESLRGSNEGHRPWNRPNTTMTNATVDTTVASVDGQTITVKYKDGEKKVIIDKGASIMRYVDGDKGELKPGVSIAINNARKKPDGTLEAVRVNAGRGDVVPD